VWVVLVPGRYVFLFLDLKGERVNEYQTAYEEDLAKASQPKVIKVSYC
jgi:hypothetical protein